MQAQNEAFDQRPDTSQNQGSASTGPHAPTTRDVGGEAEDGSEFQTPTGRNIIVAIGINEYQHQPPLNNPIEDAKEVIRLFKQCGFQELPGFSMVANEATRIAMAELPDRLAAELTTDDSLVLFFAGHGEKRERQAPDQYEPGKTNTYRIGYLIPIDGQKDKPGDWIRLDAFLDDIGSLPARHIFVILDACKSGIALDDKFKFKGGGGGEPVAVAELRRRPSRRVMTSAMHNQLAAEGGTNGSGHSVFAEALTAAIGDGKADNGDGFLKTWELFNFVQDRVGEQSNLKQTPDYGRLPLDGGGDLVISLRTGKLNRRIEEALDAMLRHDVPRLEELLAQLIAEKPAHPMTLYLQFRLKFMQGDIPAAAQLVAKLRDLNPPPGTLPLSDSDLKNLSFQLVRYAPLLSLPSVKLPIETVILTGKQLGQLEPAPLGPCPAGIAYQVEKDALAQFQVTNLSDEPMFLYYVSISPTGRLEIGPLLDPGHDHTQGLVPHATDVGLSFQVHDTTGAVREKRILCSPMVNWELFHPPTSSMRPAAALDPSVLDRIQMQTIWYQVLEDGKTRPTDVQTIISAFD
jgi:hypothetical protein